MFGISETELKILTDKKPTVINSDSFFDVCIEEINRCNNPTELKKLKEKLFSYMKLKGITLTVIDRIIE